MHGRPQERKLKLELVNLWKKRWCIYIHHSDQSICQSATCPVSPYSDISYSGLTMCLAWCIKIWCETSIVSRDIELIRYGTAVDTFLCLLLFPRIHDRQPSYSQSVIIPWTFPLTGLFDFLPLLQSLPSSLELVFRRSVLVVQNPQKNHGD